MCCFERCDHFHVTELTLNTLAFATLKGLTIYETLTHCVDLGALPSPSFARMLIGKKDIDYKSEVAYPRRTVLDLALQYGRKLSLEDLMYQVTPMKPRYYSIASSNVKHPNEIRLVYRRVQVRSLYNIPSLIFHTGISINGSYSTQC